MLFVYFDAMDSVAAWLALVGILGFPLWVFMSGFMSGYHGESRWSASNGLLRRRWSVKYWFVALLVALAGSLVFEVSKRREREKLEVSDPCRYLKAEMQRKHSELRSLTGRHVRETMSLEKQVRRQQLYLELASLDEPDLSENLDRVGEYVLRRVERERVMNIRNAEAWRKLSDRQDREWAETCELVENDSVVR
ncbi:hypothetical protein [Myxococcus sp. NMCA1]|uniref:hypothetical protein n=1 Tax=Myxococcus sp. NMCA1 TaxID=2996785 RepID=UPI002285D08E|nr:hypothetical protein [Myxococcus sp. NMCA1]WAM23921.1 hypothetical protein OZ403_25625 [Myxococcus sp. NMCA1]